VSPARGWRYAPRAERDVEEILSRLVLDSGRPDLAQAFVTDLERTLEHVCRFPRSGGECRVLWRAARDARARELLRFSKYLVFYVHRRGAIVVLRVLHGSRDIADRRGADRAR